MQNPLCWSYAFTAVIGESLNIFKFMGNEAISTPWGLGCTMGLVIAELKKENQFISR